MTIHSRPLLAVAFFLLTAAQIAPRVPATAPRAPSPAAKRSAAAVLARAAKARTEARNMARYDETFEKYTKRFFGPGWDWRRFKAQSMAESELNPNALSPVGARGLMQLMPSTFKQIQSVKPEFTSIDDPEWNIAAGIMHDRYLWRYWDKKIPEANRYHFMYASYNAGQGTISNATRIATERQLDFSTWSNIETIAPTVPRWRYRETLGYVRKIDTFYDLLKQTQGPGK